MKRLLFIPFIISFFISCNEPVKGRNGELYRSASQYNDYIVSRQSKVMKNVMDFVSVSETNLDSAEKMLDVYILQMDEVIKEIGGMPPYKGDSALRDAAKATFVFYRQIFGKEYKEIIAIRREGGAFTEEGVAEMDGIVERISREEEGYDKAFHNAQKDFAVKNNMKLTDNEMQKQIDKLNEKYQ
jgi:hypothetical protein